MNIRLTLLLVIVLCLVVSAVFISRALSTKEPADQEPQLFKVKETDIVNVAVSYEGLSIDYAKGQDGWAIVSTDEDMPVSQRWAGTTLVLSGPRCTRAVSETIDDPSIYGLDDPTMTVQITVVGGLKIEFHLGGKTPEAQDPKWYARLAGSQRLCTLPDIYGTVVQRLVTDPPYPDDRLLFRVAEDEMFSISVVHGDGEVSFGRKANQWVGQGKDGIEKLASTEWTGMPQLLGSPLCVQPVLDGDPDMAKYGFENPDVNVLIFSQKGDFTEYELGRPTSDNPPLQYARVVESNRFCQVPNQNRDLLIGLVANPPFEEIPQE